MSAHESSVPGGQDAVRRWLADPATHGLEGPVQVVETHANLVFLAGPTAWKLKKAVRFPFLDYSTLERREAACRREVERNAPAAPEIYRRAVPVTAPAGGGFALGGDGPAVEWLVEMARFDETRTLDRVLAEGPLPEPLVADLARSVAAAQALAPPRDAGPWIDDLARYVEQNDAAFRAEPDLFPPAAVAGLAAAARAWHGRIADLLAERGRLGTVRLLHGDLHAGNVVLVDGRPVVFDGIEFDDAIATADLLYDAGFLVMDLDERGHRAEAALLLNRFLVETVRHEARRGGDVADLLRRETEALAALPFFLMMRAAIRAKVTAARAAAVGGPDAAALRRSALGYFDAARRYLDPAEPVLVAVGGLSGTGKSTLARRLAPLLGRAPGALHLRTDVIRKLLQRAPEHEPLPPEAYAPERRAEVFDLIARLARTGLAAGRAVVVDAVAARPEERQAFARAAGAAQARFAGLWLEAPLDTRLGRVERRTADASDADGSVVRVQDGYDLGPLDWIRVGSGGSPGETFATARAALARVGVPLSEPE
ncbi:bifunctional aminoglycoside phosphotransferase/ATP-binding protein [Prosthecomicrobium sp. N25]|uniref:bifunctional aminoglycoside phosphotransferase/ATP-binding protein n=1 Tax=Prosthecomicrobium sp. N25 TaxID=3129254 RepID=UPI00307776F4